MVIGLSPSACDLFEKSNLAIHFDLEVHILNMWSQNGVTRGADEVPRGAKQCFQRAKLCFQRVERCFERVKQCFERAKRCFQRAKQCFQRVIRVKTVF